MKGYLLPGSILLNREKSGRHAIAAPMAAAPTTRFALAPSLPSSFSTSILGSIDQIFDFPSYMTQVD